MSDHIPSELDGAAQESRTLEPRAPCNPRGRRNCQGKIADLVHVRCDADLVSFSSDRFRFIKNRLDICENRSVPRRRRTTDRISSRSDPQCPYCRPAWSRMSLALPSAEQPRVRSYPVDSIEAQSASASIGRQDADSSHLSRLGCVRWTRSRTARASLSAEACFTLPLHCILHPSLHQSEECKRLRILFDRSEAEACTERALNPCEAGTTPPSAARCVTGPRDVVPASHLRAKCSI
jgi:hypothetical protein